MTPFWFKCRFFAMSLDCDGGTNIVRIYRMAIAIPGVLIFQKQVEQKLVTKSDAILLCVKLLAQSGVLTENRGVKNLAI